MASTDPCFLVFTPLILRCNKKHTLPSLSPTPGQSSLNLCTFLSDKDALFEYLVFDSDSWAPKFLGISWVVEVCFVLTSWFSMLLDSSRMGAGHHKDWVMIRRFLAPHPTQGKDLIINHSHIMKLPLKFLNYRVQGASKLLNKSMYWKHGTPKLQRSYMGTLSNLFLCIPLSGCHPYPVLHNKMVSISISLSSVTYSSKLSNLRMGSWEPQFIDSVIRSMSGSLGLVVDVSSLEDGLVGLSP